MFDRGLGLARIQSEDAADKPATREARVEGQCAVHQLQHGADVLAEIAQRVGGIRQDSRVVTGHLHGAPCVFGALQAVRRWIFAPAVKQQPVTAERRPGERGPVMRIAVDRQFKQAERLRTATRWDGFVTVTGVRLEGT